MAISANKTKSVPATLSPRITISRSVVRSLLFFATITLLCVVNLLLPVERSNLIIWIVGYPLTLPLFFNIIVFLLILVESQGEVLRGFSTKYVLFQSFMVLILLGSALISSDVIAAMFVVLVYISAFILNFVLLYYFLKRGYREWFLKIFCSVLVVALLIGLIEGLFRYYIPFYRDLFLDYDYQRNYYAMFVRKEFRVFGPLGNPLIYSTALVFSLAFIAQIRNGFLRLTLYMLAFTVIFLSGSRSTFILSIIFFFLLVVRRRKISSTVILTSLVILVIVAVPLYKNLPASSRILGTSVSEQNVQARMTLIGWALDYFKTLDFVGKVIGIGLKGTIDLVTNLNVLAGLDTLDNVYTTLLIEAGLLGLVTYIALNLWLILRYRRSKDPAKYIVILNLLLGFLFVTVYYASINFVWTACIAFLMTDQYGRDSQTTRSLCSEHSPNLEA